METGTQIKLIIGAIGGFLISLLGGWDASLSVLGTLICLDIVSGILKAIHNRKLSSLIGYLGLGKKVGCLIFIAVAHQFTLFIGGAMPFREMFITFFIANEGLSILENLAAMDVPYINKFKVYLEQLKSDSENGENKK